MPKSLKRALRRHHYRRLKRKRERFWYGTYSAPMGPRHLGMAIATPKVCSCWMCGNPRRYFREKTLQERKADLALRGREYESDVANVQPAPRSRRATRPITRPRFLTSEVRRDIGRRAREAGADGTPSVHDALRGARGRLARGYHRGLNIVVLDPDVAERFPNSEAVNQALRSLAAIQDRKEGLLD